MSNCSNSSLLGTKETYIKVSNSSFIAVEGSASLEKMEVSLLKCPYKQYFKTRIFLQAGAANQPINYANLGDNVTFLAIAAYYDPKSKIEADNYIMYHFETDPDTKFPIAQMLVLTGNSTNRIPQIYLTNPNPLYPVKVEILCACIDLNMAFFNNMSLPSNNNITITDLEYDDIQTHVQNQNIKVINALNQVMLYLNIVDIAAIERSGHILIVDDNSMGKVYFDFVNTYNALQAFSAISWMLEDPTNRTLPQPTDDTPPVINFTTNVVANAASLTLANAPYLGTVTKPQLISYLIDNVTDARDGLILIGIGDIQIEQSGLYYSQITLTGTYNIIINVKDIAENNAQEIVVLTVV